MKIKAFFLFPDNDDDFLRIGENPQSYKDLIGEITIIKKLLKCHRDFELYYDSTNVDAFLIKAETLIGEYYLAKCRIQLQHIFGNFSRNVSTTHFRKLDCIYVHWNINRTIVDSKLIISEAAEAKYNEGTDKTVIINIADAFINNRDCIHIIKDAVFYNELPTLVSIPTVNNETEFSQWLTTLSTPEFSLSDKNRFQATAFKWKKQRIYKETTTNNYWYYDFFHHMNKKHFEVFNSQGIHIGEANIYGVLDTTKADNNKQIVHIIQ